MPPEEARLVANKVNRQDRLLQDALRMIRWSAEAGRRETDLSYARGARRKLRDMGYKVRWSLAYCDWVVSW